MILPLTVFGRESTNSITLGYLYGAVLPLTKSWSSLESVQQSLSGSRYAFCHSTLQNEMQIWSQMRRTVIPQFETNFEHLKIEY